MYVNFKYWKHNIEINVLNTRRHTYIYRYKHLNVRFLVVKRWIQNQMKKLFQSSMCVTLHTHTYINITRVFEDRTRKWKESHRIYWMLSLYRTELKLTVIRMYSNRMPRHKAIFCFIFKCFTKEKDGWSMYIINNIYQKNSASFHWATIS